MAERYKAGIVFFTDKGKIQAEKIKSCLKEIEFDVEFRNSSEKLSEWVKMAFEKLNLIIFVSATGIAVRSISNFIKSKTVDPAVLVVDDMGSFVISLLSGHIGGGNKWTRFIGENIGAMPVITTATDVSGKFAVDSWAKEEGLLIDDIKPAKDISMNILKDKKVYVYSDIGFQSEDSQVVQVCNSDIEFYLDKETYLSELEFGTGINVSYYKNKVFEKELRLTPKVLVLGIGCRRDTPKKDIEDLVVLKFRELNLKKEAILEVVSIDLKLNEKGLIEFCNEWKLPFRTFSANRLLEVDGEFPSSSFVKSITGVDNVCQRASVLASENGKVLLEKTSRKGVTLSIAVKGKDVYVK